MKLLRTDVFISVSFLLIHHFQLNDVVTDFTTLDILVDLPVTYPFTNRFSTSYPLRQRDQIRYL